MDKGDLVKNDLSPTLNAGDPTHSLYSPSTAPRVICVGATSYRQSYTNISDEPVVNNWGSNGERGGYSGIGPTLYGRIKPDVVAPGTNVLSSMSSYYLDEHPDEIRSTVVYSEYNGRRYPWAAETGTSMSAPLVGGIIACWLQARPDLSPEDILELFGKTCTQREDYTYPNNEYGYGEIDAYQGLLQILGLSGIPSISHHQPQQVDFLLHDHRLTISFHESSTAVVQLSIYNLKGECLLQHTIPQGTSTIDIPLPFAKGVYAVQLNSQSPTLQGSTLIRW